MSKDIARFIRVSDIREQYNLLTSSLWVNNYYKASFTISRTGEGIYEWYWYSLNIQSGLKEEWVFCFQDGKFLIQFGNKVYHIHYMDIDDSAVTRVIILQLENIAKPREFYNFVGYSIPPKQEPRKLLPDIHMLGRKPPKIKVPKWKERRTNY